MWPLRFGLTKFQLCSTTDWAMFAFFKNSLTEKQVFFLYFINRRIESCSWRLFDKSIVTIHLLNIENNNLDNNIITEVTHRIPCTCCSIRFWRDRSHARITIRFHIKSFVRNVNDNSRISMCTDHLQSTSIYSTTQCTVQNSCRIWLHSIESKTHSILLFPLNWTNRKKVEFFLNKFSQKWVVVHKLYTVQKICYNIKKNTF